MSARLVLPDRAEGPRRDVSLLLVEDDAMVRSWVRLSLCASEFRVAAEASSAVEALELVGLIEPDLLLVDYRLPDRRGTELIRELRTGGVTAPALLMTANHEQGLDETAHDVGAQGAISKRTNPVELIEALRAVLAGDLAFDPSHPPRDRRRAPLTRRQRDVLKLVARGARNADIARELGVGVETVKTQLHRSYHKLGVRTRAQAVAVAQELGLL
jgi:DNA-binding NarL/FixJ family response regulator